MTLEVLLPTALAAGFFGSTHCLAMCGAVVVLLEGGRAAQDRGWPLRLLYNSGRLAFYVTLGGAAGASGQLMTAGFDSGLLLLRYLSALLIVLLGVNLLLGRSLLRYLEQAGAVLWQRMAPLARRVLPVSSPGTALAAGFLWGALPCGLVYSAVALAATSGNAAAGSLVMLAFWLGTLPALLLAGASAVRLHRWRQRRSLRYAAGVLLIALGLLAAWIPGLHRAAAHSAQPAASLFGSAPAVVSCQEDRRHDLTPTQLPRLAGRRGARYNSCPTTP